MPGSTSQQRDQRRVRPVFGSVCVLALCMVIPAFSSFAAVFAVGLGVVAIALLVQLTRLALHRWR